MNHVWFALFTLIYSACYLVALLVITGVLVEVLINVSDRRKNGGL